MNFEEGELVGGRYEVIALLGYGSYGPTYLVRPNVGALCVLHVLEDLYGAEGEEVLVGRAPYDMPSHRNVTLVLDSWLDRMTTTEHYRNYASDLRRGYIVREAVDGRQLGAVAIKTQGVPPLHVAYRIAADAARGVAAMHARGHIARLMGPDQIFIAYGGVTKIKVLAGEQILRRASSITGGRQLRPSMLKYFGPEGLRGEAWTKKVDVYSLGVLLWELTIGPRIDSPSSTLEFISGVLEWSAYHAMPRNVSDGLSTLLLSALHDDPSERPTAREMARRLDDLSGSNSKAGNGDVAAWLASQPSRNESSAFCKGIDSAQTTLRPIDPVEHEFLACLRKSTEDEDDQDVRAMREVYSDWLEERGDWIKAAYLRLVLARPWKRSNAERRALEVDLDPFWCRAVRGNECLLEHESEDEERERRAFQAQPPDPTTLLPDPLPDPLHDRPTLRVIDPMWWMPQT